MNGTNTTIHQFAEDRVRALLPMQTLGRSGLIMVAGTAGKGESRLKGLYPRRCEAVRLGNYW